MKRKTDCTISLLGGVLAFVLSALVCGYLFDHGIVFVENGTAAFSFLSLLSMFFGYLIHDWVSIMIVAGIFVLAWIYRGRLTDAIDRILIGWETSQHLILYWVFVVIAALLGKAVPLAGVFAAMVIPFMTGLTVYRILRRKS